MRPAVPNKKILPTSNKMYFSMKIIYRSLFIILLLFNNSRSLQAQQQNDSAALAKLFLQACNHYQHFPLQLKIKIKSKVNYLTSPADTIQSFIEMDVKENSSYINMGDVEQIMNDSLLLIVNKVSKVLAVYPGTNGVKQRDNQYLKGISITDSSVKKFMNYYDVLQISNGFIIAKSHKLSGRSSLSSSELRVKYNTADTLIQEVVQTARKPVSIDSAIYAGLSSDPNWNGKLFSSGNKQWYLIKEQITDYVYEQITHENIQPPVEIKDRLLKDSKGNFYAAKEYEQYRISNNL